MLVICPPAWYSLSARAPLWGSPITKDYKGFIMTKKSKQKSALRIASSVMASTGLLAAGAAQAENNANPFGYEELPSSFRIAGEGQCGEGSCGEGSCGNKKDKAEGSCGEGSCGNKKKKKGMHMKMMQRKMSDMEKQMDKMMMMMQEMQKKMK